MTKRVSLRVEESAGANRSGWTITQGIPFPDAELSRGTPVQVLDSQGNSLPTQHMCMATWDKQGEYVKWLLVDFQVDIEANECKNLHLEYYSERKSVPPESPVSVSETDEEITISTGVLELKLRRGTPDFWGSCTVKTKDNEMRELFQNRPGPYLFIKDNKGNLYTSHGQAPAPRIMIEDKGPVRASVCIKGYHASKEGVLFCPYVLRIHAYAGKPYLRIFHTFIFDQNPEHVQLSEIGMRFPLKLGARLHGVFGGDEEPFRFSNCADANLLQSGLNEYFVRVGEKTSGSGRKAPGMMQITGQCGSVVVVQRDLWKEYPKEIGIREEDLCILFWPQSYGAPLAFSCPWKESWIRFESIDEEDFVERLKQYPSAPLNLKSTGVGDKYFGMTDIEAARKVWDLVRRYASERHAAFCDTHTFNGYGAAKTHEFLIHLSCDPISDEECENLNRCVQEPVIAPANPDYMCSTGALRLVHPRDNKNFPEMEKALEDIFAKLILEPQEECGIFGALDYGELINGHTRANPFVYRLFKQEPSLFPDILQVLGVFNNEAQDIVHQLWIYFARTGERKYFQFAEAKSEHTEDLDIIHACPFRPEWEGLIHYHSVTNWSGTPSHSHTLISGFMLHYYFTGNRRALEVAREVADHHLRDQEPCGVISNRKSQLHREFTGPLMNLLEIYQATWEEKYGKLAYQSLDWLRRTVGPTGNLPVSVYTRGIKGDEIWASGTNNRRDYPGGMLCHILYDALQIFREEWIEEWILSFADTWTYEVPCDDYVTGAQVHKLKIGPPIYKIDEDWCWRPFLSYPNNYVDPIISLAFELTRNVRYAAYLQHRLSIFPQIAQDLCSLFYGQAFQAITLFGYSIPSIMSAPAATDKEVLEKAAEEWREERARRDQPVFAGDRKRFDREGNVIGANPIITEPASRDTTEYFLGKWEPKGQQFGEISGKRSQYGV